MTDGTPAAKAGLHAHDVLIGINGQDVPADVGQFLKLLDGIKVDTPFDGIVVPKANAKRSRA